VRGRVAGAKAVPGWAAVGLRPGHLELLPHGAVAAHVVASDCRPLLPHPLHAATPAVLYCRVVALPP
jgi:hypothetical protein